MCYVEHLSKEVSQAGMCIDSLPIYESFEVAIIVPLVGMMEGPCGNLRDVFGVTQHPIEIKNYEGLCWVSSPMAEGLRFISRDHVINKLTSLMLWFSKEIYIKHEEDASWRKEEVQEQHSKDHIVKGTFAYEWLWMMAECGKMHHSWKLICEHDFMSIRERSFMKEVDLGSHPFTSVHSWTR